MTNTMLLAMLWGFTVKHFLADFPLQSFPYMYKNKGTYGHPGGLLHAGIHAIMTTLLLALFVPVEIAVWFGLLDGLTHYHIDWAKMNIGKHFNLTPTNSEVFWILLGLDQLLHYATYLGIAWIITGGTNA